MEFSLHKIKEVMEKIIEKEELNAGHRGEMGRGLAGTYEEQLKFFILGARERWTHKFEIPKEWIKYFRELDPEYKKYLELKEKFNE